MRFVLIVCLLLAIFSDSAIAQSNPIDSVAIWTSADDEPANCMAWGDVDHDGDLDLMCGGPNGLSLYYNAGGALERTARWRSSESYFVTDMAWADIDNDGNLDLVTAGYNWEYDPDSVYHSYDSVRIYFGSKDLLNASAQWANHLVSRISGISLGDYNNDGWVDLACGGRIPEFDSYDHFFVFNNVGGEFESQFSWSSPDRFRLDRNDDVHWVDFDRDGDIDMFCEVDTYYLASRIYENSNGELGDVAKWAPTDVARQVQYLIGDLEGDGFEDIIVNGESGEVSVYENYGGWLINPASELIFNTGYQPVHIELTDIDRDGDLDFIFGGGRIHIMSMESGTLLTDTTWITEPLFGEVDAIADINGDGFFEIAGASTVNNPKTLHGRDALPLMDTIPSRAVTVGYHMHQMILTDLDNDGDLDLAAASQDSTLSHVVLNNDGVFDENRLVLYNGGFAVAGADCDGNGFTDIAFDLGNNHIGIFLNSNGYFETEPNIVVSTGGTTSITFGDLDGDGYPDMVSRSEDSLYIHHNVNGTFDSLPTATIDLPYIPFDFFTEPNVKLADMDKDGDLDVITDGIYLNDGGIITSTPSWLPDKDIANIAIGDIDGNGYPDVVCAPEHGLYNHRGYVYLNDRGIVSTTPDWTSADYTGHKVRCIDIENDGDLDLVFGPSFPNLLDSKVYLNENGINGTADFTIGAADRSTIATSAMAVGDIDLDGDMDIVTNGGLRLEDGYRTAYITFENNRILGCSSDAQTPNSGPCVKIRSVEALEDQENIVELGIELIDSESDVCNVTLEYSEIGGGSWTTAHTVENTARLESSPGGVLHYIHWDTESDGVDGYDVWLRLKVESMPIHGETIQYPAQFLLRKVGRIDNRPRIAVVYPRMNSVVIDSLQILGRIWDATNFNNYSIKIGKLPDTLEWTIVQESDTSVHINGTLASIDLSDQNAGKYMLRFEATDFSQKRNIRDVPITVADKSPQAPSVIRSYPPLGSSDIPGNAPVVVQFDQDMNESSLDNSAMVLYSELGETYANSQYDYASKTLTLFPDREYTPGKFHYFVVGSHLLNEQGDPMGGEFVSYFNSVDGSPANDIDSLSPFRGQTEVSVNLDSLRVYYDGPSLHTHVKIFDLDGNIVANGTLQGGLSPGSIGLPQLLPRTYYLVTIYDPREGNSTAFMSYFVTEDTQLPLAVDYAPDDKSWLVGLDSPVLVEFNKPMNTFSIDESSFSVTGPTGAVPGVIEFGGEDGTIATFYANEPLEPGSNYTVVLTDHIQDNIGNPITPLSWSFTTGVFGMASHDGSVVSSPGVELSFPLGAISPDIEVGLGQVPAEKIPVERELDFAGVAYEIRPAMDLQREAILTITLPDSLFATGSERYALCYRDTAVGSWQYIGGTQTGRELTSSIDRLGTYGVFLSSGAEIAATNLEASLSLLPRVISPRTGGINGRLNISFRVAEATTVIARIYDTSGRLVKTLAAGSVAQIGENLLSWDGRTDDGEYATDGLHVVVIEAAGQKAQKTFVILNK